MVSRPVVTISDNKTEVRIKHKSHLGYLIAHEKLVYTEMDGPFELEERHGPASTIDYAYATFVK